MNDRCRILIVDDDESTRKTLALVLRKKQYETEMAATGQEALEKARENAFNLIFLDIRLPDMEGVDLIAPLKKINPRMAVFMITGHASVETAIQALNDGATGFITKPVNVDELLAMVREATEKQRLIEEKKQAEKALQESEQNFRDMVENLLDGVAIADQNGRHIYVNPKFADITGYSVDELLGMTGWDLSRPEDIELLKQRMQQRMVSDEYPREYERFFLKKDGTEVLTEMSTTTTLWQGQKRPMAIIRDITEKRVLEAQLRQAQKMEAVGRLAGGVAHDFNNMLTVILGYLAMILVDLNPADLLYRDLEEIRKAAEHSAELTRQLLAFSRKQMAVPKVIDINEIITHQKKMLERLIGEDIRIDFVPADSLWHVRIDPSQVDQILTNLAVNARDAIGGVGTVTIRTSNVKIDAASGHRDLASGEYVMLRFEDNGCGMDAETLEHVFEPFFTTKDVGEGTGLGLATVYGIVAQNNGEIEVHSEMGVGTSFRIYIPRFQKAAGSSEEIMPEEELAGGTETVLIVEDEEQILRLAQRLLEQNGYTVLAARVPEEAVRLAEQHDAGIDLLLTDVVMPAMNGKDLEARIQQNHPEVKTLFMSGYTRDIIVDRGIIYKDVEFIQKPFTLKSLTTRVREVLDTNGE